MRRLKTGRFMHFLGGCMMLLVFANTLSGQGLNNLNLHIDAEDASIYSILESLEKQTGYYFTFDSRLADRDARYSIKLDGISIQEAIDTLFRKHDLTYQIIHNNIVIIPGNQVANLDKRQPAKKELGIIEIKGNVKDMHSLKPLPYASVALVNTPVGTITNDDGTFLLRIPDTLQQPVIIVSYMGYKNQYAPVTLADKEPMEILLNKNVISLQEVIIRYQDPYKLLSEALKNIRVNYSDEPSGMRAYYREKVMRDDKCMIFSEAVVDIVKAPYTNSYTVERSKILKGRKITNIDLQDTVVLKIRSGINTMLQLDIVNFKPDFLSLDFYRKYNLEFVDLVSYNDRLVYIISFKQKEFVEETLFKGELYIDQLNYAIVAASFEYDPQRIGREQDMFVQKKSRNLRIRPTSTRYHVEYAMTGNRFHLSQVKGEVKFKVRKKRQWIASKYRINLEMAVTGFRPGDPPEIKISEQVRPSTILAEELFEYDPEFWGEYNIIQPETELMDALERIEKSIREVTEE